MTRDELYAEAKRLNIVGRSKMSKQALEVAVRLAAEQQTWQDADDAERDNRPWEDSCVTPAAEQAIAEANEWTTEELAKLKADQDKDWSDATAEADTIIATNKAAKPKLMGLHYRGRALGLKHYQLMGLAYGRTMGKRPTPELKARQSAPAHMPNSERVQKYAATMWGRMPSLCELKPKLTPKQMRRVRKAADKHGEGFMYFPLGRQKAFTEGYSLLARAPEGLGIFHKFSS